MSAPMGDDFLDTLGNQPEEGAPVGDDLDQQDPSQLLNPDDNQDAQNADEDELPDDPEALKALVQAERERRANAQRALGRQGDELGQYRQLFEQMISPGVAGPTPPPTPGAPLAPGIPALPSPGAGDAYAQALDTAASKYHGLVNQGYDAQACYQQYQREVAQANQAEMQRQMFTFASSLHNQQSQFANFERAFFGAHPELEDTRARNLFNLHLLQAKVSGMYRNPVDAYEAAQKATVQYLTDLGYEAVEAHEGARAKARGLGMPGPRGARPGGAQVSPEQAIAQLNAAAAQTHEAAQQRLRRPSAAAPQK